MIGNQFCKQPEHRQNFGIVHLRRTRVDCAQRPEKRAVNQGNRNGYVTLEAILQRRMSTNQDIALVDMIDRDRLMILADLVADGGFDLEFVAGL